MFYRISLKEQRGAFHIKHEIEYSYKNIFHNPEPLKNQTFKVYKGTKKMDVMGYCETVSFAISERFKNLLEENNISGWASYPILIENFEDNYFGFQVTGKGGEVTNRDKYDDAPMFKTVKWNKEKWYGSNIFYIEETFISVCTQQVKEIIEKAIITNISLNLCNVSTNLSS